MSDFWNNVKKRPYLGVAGGFVGDDFFTSEREKQAKKLYGAGIGEYDSVLNDIDNMNSVLSGVKNTGDVRSRFGLPTFNRKSFEADVDKTFQPNRGALATRFARIRKDARNRMSGTTANPDALFSEIDAGEGAAFGDLESQIGQAKMQGYDRETQDNEYIARLLQSIFNTQDEFTMRKPSMKLNALSGKNNLQSAYLGSLSDDSSFDDMLGIIDVGAKIAGLF